MKEKYVKKYLINVFELSGQNIAIKINIIFTYGPQSDYFWALVKLFFYRGPPLFISPLVSKSTDSSLNTSYLCGWDSVWLSSASALRTWKIASHEE